MTAAIAVLGLRTYRESGNGLAGGDLSTSQRRSWAGTEPAPEFPGGLTWFNVDKPLTISDLKGKAVLLDFWTLGCINCQDIIPDLKRLEDEYGSALVVIGVHSGKYSTEHDDQSIKDAIAKYGLQHPVVNDANFAVWNTYGANAWPTIVLIDPAGKVVGAHVGEGVYPLFQPIIGAMLTEFEQKGLVDKTPLAQIDLAATTTSTVLSYPAKVLADEQGNRLFIADTAHNRILVSDLDGKLEYAIGSGKAGFEDGNATDSQFQQPQGMALSGDGQTLYVADTRNHAIRAVDLASGNVTTIAGTGMQASRLPGKDVKGTGTALAAPWDVLTVGKTLFLAMAGVHQIWTLDLETNVIAVFAGTSREGIENGGRLSMATLAQPSGLATDGTYLYWVDAESSSVRRVALSQESEGPVDTLVGTGLFDWGDKDGKGEQAQIQHAQGIAYADGTLYLADTYNHKIKTIDVGSREVRTLAGSERGWSDGTGGNARFDEPGGLSVAGGKVYVADTNNSLIRVIDPASGATTTLQLSNLDVAGAVAAEASVTLPAQSVAAGNGTIELELVAPDGYHLNSLAPTRVEFRPGGAVASVATPDQQVMADGASTTFHSDATFSDASGALEIDLTAYYCRTGEEALCLVQRVRLGVPVSTTTAGAAKLSLRYVLPESPGGPKSP